MQINNIIIKPVLTEKATNLTKEKVYMFEVAKKATKQQVSSGLEQLYKIKIASVRMMIRKGKKRRVGRRMTAKKLPDTKIAFVVLKEGTIDLFPQT